MGFESVEDGDASPWTKNKRERPPEIGIFQCLFFLTRIKIARFTAYLFFFTSEAEGRASFR